MDVKDFHEIFEHEIQVINKRREEFGHRLIVLEEVDRQRGKECEEQPSVDSNVERNGRTLFNI